MVNGPVNEGWAAYWGGAARTDNPYHNQCNREAWEDGWLCARGEDPHNKHRRTVLAIFGCIAAMIVATALHSLEII